MNYLKMNKDIKKIISNYLSVNKNTVREINKINLQKIRFICNYCEWRPMNLTFTAKVFKDKEYIDYLYYEYGGYS